MIFSWIKKSFLRQVASLMITLGVTTVAVYGFINYKNLDAQWRGLAQNEAVELTDLIADIVSDEVRYRHHYEIWTKLNNIKENNEIRDGLILFKITTISIIDMSGNVLGSTSPELFSLGKKYEGKVPGGIRSQHKDSGDHVDILQWDIEGSSLLVMSSVMDGGEELGKIIINFDMSPLNLYSSKIITGFSLYIAVSIFIIFLLSLLISRWITNPIEYMAKALENIGSGKLILDVLAKKENEFKSLGKAIEEADKRIFEDETKLSEHRLNLESLIEQRTTELIHSKEDAERANSAKSEFLSRMSHELRTPMNAILGFAQVLDMKDSDPLTQQQAQSVDEILQAGNHLLELINEVLDLSRIEAGKVTVDMSTIDIGDILQECLSLVEPLAKNRNISITKVACGCGGPLFFADRLKLKQVIVNVLSNAVKYNHENGSISIACGETDDDRVYIKITDTGVGISEDDLKKLFIPFERLEQNISVEGTGIGLVISTKLVELMGGEFSVESKQGSGSTFAVYLQRPRLETSS